MKKVIIFQSEDIKSKVSHYTSFSSEYFISNSNRQKDIFKIIRKNSISHALFVDEKLNYNIVFKKLGSWKIISKIDLDMINLEKMNIKPEGPKNLSNSIPFGKPTNLVSISLDGFKYHESIMADVIKNIIDLFESDKSGLIVKEFSEKYGNYKFSSKIVKKDRIVGLDLLKSQISRGNQVRGLAKINDFDFENFLFNITMENSIIFTDSILKSNDNNLNLGNSDIKDMDSDSNEVRIYSLIKSSNEINNHYLNRSLLNNFINHITLNMTGTQKRKLKPKEILLSIIGFILLLVLLYLTFTTIISPGSVENSFKIIFGLNTYKHIWIYLLWFNFFISFFFGFIMMYILSYAVQRKRPRAINVWNIFVAASIRTAAVMLTGQELLGLFLWGYWMVRKNEVRVSSLVGMVAFMQVVRGVVTLFVGIPFMVIGQIYISNTVFSVVDYDISSIFLYTLSWGGLIWFLLDKAIRGGVVYMPPAHYVYNKVYNLITYLRKDPNVFEIMQHREMGLLNLKSSTSNMLLNKERLYRISLSITLMIFIEAFELMYVFNIVEQSQSNWDPIIHYNFLQLSGARYMITQINHFPIINVMPGNGVGVIEHFMDNTYKYIFLASHNANINDPELMSNAKEFADQTTFITRFYNSYFPTILRLSIATFAIAKLAIRGKF